MPDLKIQNNQLSEMEIDVIGEVMNISMGSAATAMSTILDKKVNITTPTTQVLPVEEFEFTYLEPVVGVLIKYVEGIDGSNVLLLREEDLQKILQHLLGLDEGAPFELDEISMSAICEIMNQMMGSAASALASFLGKTVNISPPEIMDVADSSNVREVFLLQDDFVVSIKFNLIIDGLVESEFLCAMEPKLVKEIVQMSLGVSEMEEEQLEETQETEKVSEEETVEIEEETPTEEEQTVAEKQAEPSVEPQPQPAPQQQPQPVAPQPQSQPVAPQPQPQPTPQPQEVAMQTMSPRPAKSVEPIQVSPYTYKQLGGSSKGGLTAEEENNLELIMAVPIQITVELGRTRRKIKDIAELTLGNIVELERQAGDQVDVLANGKLIARGDVVVVDDKYSVRVTEIIKREENVHDEKEK